MQDTVVDLNVGCKARSWVTRVKLEHAGIGSHPVSQIDGEVE
jgi:hypothetical protein